MKVAAQKKVLLVYPYSAPCLREDRCQVPAGNPVMSPALPPTDLLYLAAIGERAGCLCRIEDYSSRQVSLVRVLEKIQEFDPAYLVVTVTTPTIKQDLAFCSAVKRGMPGVQIIAKGAHTLRFDRNMMEQCPELDLIIRGEPETAFQEILSGKPFADIPGLTWRKLDGSIRKNDDRPYNDSLDELPFPARHLIDNGRYVRPDTGMPQAVISVSRGCPYHCFYCLATPVSGKKVRRRSPDNILAEIRECVKNYGIYDFLFWSDVFNTDRSWVLSLCTAIRESGLPVRWSANSRAAGVDRETADAMRKAGCTLVSVGVESGSQELLDRIGKNIHLDQVRAAFSILKKSGIATIAYYQIGLPWETRQTAEETIRLALELDSDYASFFLSAPFPGTRFYEYAVEQGLFDDPDTDKLPPFDDAYFEPIVGGHVLGKKELRELRNAAVRKYFYRPRYILRNISRIRSWRQLLSYVSAAGSLTLTCIGRGQAESIFQPIRKAGLQTNERAMSEGPPVSSRRF